MFILFLHQLVPRNIDLHDTKIENRKKKKVGDRKGELSRREYSLSLNLASLLLCCEIVSHALKRAGSRVYTLINITT